MWGTPTSTNTKSIVAITAPLLTPQLNTQLLEELGEREEADDLLASLIKLTEREE